MCENHNKEFHDGNTTYELALDEFSLLPFEELVRLRTGYIPENDTDVVEDSDQADESDLVVVNAGRGGRTVIPTSFSWLNTYGVVRPVQNQGSCASCWAFASKFLKNKSFEFFFWSCTKS